MTTTQLQLNDQQRSNILHQSITMAMNIPKTTKQWNVATVDGKDGFDALTYSEQQVPELGDSEVLVKCKSCGHFAIRAVS